MRAGLSATLIAGLLVFGAVLGLVRFGALERVELLLYDRLLEASLDADAHSPVLIVEVGEADIRDLGHWPISDRKLAEALSRLADAGVRMIGLDIYRDLPVSPGSDALARVLREQDRIVAVRSFGREDGYGIPGPPALEGTGRVGFNDLLPDADGVVRRWLLYQDDGRGEVEPAFSLLLALRALAAEGVSLGPDPERPGGLRLGPSAIRPFAFRDGGYVRADDRGYQMLLDYAAAGSGLERVRLSALLRGEVDAERLRDRVVLVGSSAESVGDFFPAPVGDAPVPGVVLHGLAVDQLIRFGRGLALPRWVVSEGAEASLLAIVCIAGCALGLGFPGRPAFSAPTLVGTVLLGGVALWLAASAVFRAGGWVPLAAPTLAWVSAFGIVSVWVSSRERAARDQLGRIFARAVSPDVAKEIWRRRAEIFDEGRLRPQRLTASVLFVDLRAYTVQAERMEPEQLMRWSNAFMERMADCIKASGGVVDDYFGDGIKADFGVPIPRTSEAEVRADARRAVQCALDMEAALPRLNRQQRERGLPEYAMKIGIDTGPVAAVAVGSSERFKYTVVGVVPVTAQRLEATRDVHHDYRARPCRILISQNTRERVAEAFRLEAAGRIPLRGLAEPLEVYRVEAAADGCEPVHSASPAAWPKLPVWRARS